MALLFLEEAKRLMPLDLNLEGKLKDRYVSDLNRELAFLKVQMKVIN